MTADPSPEQPVCKPCGASPVVAEIEGRVLVCARCRDDDELAEHARKDWR